MRLAGAASATTTTGSSGSYSFTGLANGSYSVTPSLSGYAFTPANSAVTLNEANVSGQNFTSLANPPPLPTSWLWGVTTDDPASSTAQQVDALKSLPVRTMVRTVFDLASGGHPAAVDYVSSVTALATVADVMGQPVDSSYMPALTLAAVQARITEYLGTLGPFVSVWEIGNEVNGNWLGSGVMPKLEAMFDAVKAAGKPTALTFYYENPATPGYDLIPWADANIPPGHRMRTGLNYVLVSYYEDQNNGHQLTQAELDALFSALAARFPNAKLGFGEFGWGNSIPASATTRADMLRRFYGYRIPSVPAYVGGGFYWHFLQTMVPKTAPDWSVLNDLETQAP
ncbi:SdrD B-like domain-containing protein [Geothrix oryzae]|nr:SdrD B-like domain-containing protein [Geothrix oryzae]